MVKLPGARNSEIEKNVQNENSVYQLFNVRQWFNVQLFTHLVSHKMC